MKIGIIFGMEFTKPFGISRYVIELAKSLNNENEVHLLIADDYFNLPRVIIHKNPLSRISRIRINSNISSLKSVLHIFDITFRLIFNSVYNPFFSRKIKKKYGLDIIHSQSIDSLTADIVTMHSCFKAARIEEDISSETNLSRRLIGKILFSPFNSAYLITEKQIVKNSKKIIVVSEKLKHDFIDYYGVAEDKIVVIPNGVNLNKFKPNQTTRRKIRDLYGIKETEIVLIFVGHLFKIKGLDYIIEAISNMDDIKLLVVGEDPNIESYKENVMRVGIQEKVIFVGKILNGIEEYYAASDIYLLPSFSEGFPISGIEAAATGLPIICTKVAGFDEMIIDSYNGFFVNRDSKQIREKIQILTNKERRTQMGINAKTTSEKYSWEIVARKTMQVYKEVLGANFENYRSTL